MRIPSPQHFARSTEKKKGFYNTNMSLQMQYDLASHLKVKERIETGHAEQGSLNLY